MKLLFGLQDLGSVTRDKDLDDALFGFFRDQVSFVFYLLFVVFFTSSFFYWFSSLFFLM